MPLAIRVRALWKKKRPKSKSEAEMGSPSIRTVLFHQVPAARANHQYSRGLAQFVELSFGAGVGDGAANGIAQVDLPLDDVTPGGRIGIFEIGHEDIGAGVERVDDHLAVDGAGDFDAAVQKVGRDGGHLPVAIPDVRRGRLEIPAWLRRRFPAGVDACRRAVGGGAVRTCAPAWTRSAGLLR